MKKITIFSILLAAAFNLAAQDAFYYSRGEKIYLTKVPDKKVLISKKSANSQKNTSAIRVIEDSELIIQVFDSKINQRSNEDFGNVLAQSDCYIDSHGLELTPCGYFDIKLKHSDDYPILESVAEENNLEIVKCYKFLPLWYVLRLKDKINVSIFDLANRIYETGLFASCYPTFSFNSEELSYDPEVNQQWGLFNAEYPLADISISEAWSFATGRGVKIAIVDSGVDLDHQDLEDNILMSYDFHTNTSPSAYYSTHGTHCAGIAAAKRNNGLNIAGVAPDAKLLVAGVKTRNNSNMSAECAEAISWAWQNGADIISCSLACNKIEAVEQAIDAAMTLGRGGKGCFIVKSAGNYGTITFPGTYRNDIIVVGAIDSTGNHVTGSGIGSRLFMCAPGDSILSTIPDNKTKKETGTSMACPHVSGVIALMLERNPNLTINQVREILAETAVKIGDKSYNIEGEFGLRNNYYGYGLVNAHQAVINTPRE